MLKHKEDSTIFFLGFKERNASNSQISCVIKVRGAVTPVFFVVHDFISE
jgi:hypothetical protein